MAKKSGVHLIVYFHELWVITAPLKSSAFWLSPIQKYICQELALIADSGFFNTHWAYQWGKEILGSRAYFSPTFSNVGELDTMPPWESRKALLTVFGSPAARAEIYGSSIDIIRNHLKSGMLLELADVGASNEAISNLLTEFRGAGLTEYGLLPPSEISVLLAQTKFGMFNTPWGLASKSGIFAAYASHGVAPVSIFDEKGRYPTPSTYPLPRDHFLLHSDFAKGQERLTAQGQRVSGNVFKKYERCDDLVNKIIALL